ncbi:beta-1,3-glucan-binding protein-like isoform X1 [Littorina saxatilis]|uniref:beta-1,3-glucan-binding protein-like isoform X1 n=1 Tax=Littorina saxatilis TaxID=31220 RepID=UPI0038B63A84
MLILIFSLGVLGGGYALTDADHHVERRATTVFYDDFSSGQIDSHKWDHDVSAHGGGNEEFQIYTPDKLNSYVKNGVLYIRPTLTADRFGADIFTHGVLDLPALYGRCSGDWKGNKCLRKGDQIKPIMSGKLLSKASVRYGKIGVVAKLPKGDWLWPAIWMVPTEDHYGIWPRSGEIDIMESRGNTHYEQSGDGKPVGVTVEAVHIHYGPSWNNKKAPGVEYQLNNGHKFSDDYHTYWLDWTKDYLKLGIDTHTIKAFITPPQGHWHEGHFQGDNIWASGGKDAPFDRPFKLILNVAVGGRFFNEGLKNYPYPQPWHDAYANKSMEFWANRHLWQPTWHGEDVAMKVKSVKMVQY